LFALLAAGSSGLGATPLESGPLVIDEVYLGGANGTSFLKGIQWIELTNVGALPADTAGMRLVAGDHAPVALVTAGPVASGGVFVVLVTTDAAVALAAEAAGPLGFPLQVVLADPLPEQPETLALESDAGVIDWLAAGATFSSVDLPGAAFSLDPAFLTPEGNNDPSHWCASVDKTSLLGHLVNGTPGGLNSFCDNDADGYSEADGDCADDVAAVSPGAPEACDGVDNDCNGLTDDVAWLDGDAAPCLQVGACFGARPSCTDGAWTCTYPVGYEEAETSCDAQDNDCDGLTDEGLTNACGLCGALAEEGCDGLDNDCDGQTDDGLVPPQGLCPLSTGACATATPRCDGPAGWRCAYDAAYEVEETTCDAIDNDCDGQTDEGFPLGELCVVEVRACRATGMWGCSNDHHGVACLAPPVGVGGELCGDGVDNDCNGQIDEGFPVGDPCEVGKGACRATGLYVCTYDDLGVLCDATPLQPGVEVCDDGLDNDCDGGVDESDCAASGWTPGDPLGGGGVRCSAAFGTVQPPLPWLLLLTLAMVSFRRKQESRP